MLRHFAISDCGNSQLHRMRKGQSTEFSGLCGAARFMLIRSSTRTLIEVLGMSVAVPLMFSARRAMETAAVRVPRAASRRAQIAVACALVLVGFGIVWFATDAAMEGDVQRGMTTEISRR